MEELRLSLSLSLLFVVENNSPDSCAVVVPLTTLFGFVRPSFSVL